MSRTATLLVVFAILALVFVNAQEPARPKNCKLRRCKRPPYTIMPNTMFCRAGLRFVRCIRRVVKKCKGYKKLLTPQARKELMEQLDDARASFRQAGPKCRLPKNKASAPPTLALTLTVCLVLGHGALQIANND